MLPEESVRFFYVDQAWLDALVDGATSVGIATTLDDTITGELRTALRANPTAIPSGMLLRSHLLADYPKLLISARDTGGKDITVFRRDLGDNVLLCLFAGTPHTVTFKEPYEGIHFGIDEGDTIGLRRLSGKTGKSLEGKTLENFHNHLRKSPADGQEPDVISFLGDQGLVAALTKCLHEANEISASRNSLSPAELAIEFVNAPKEFTFSVKLGDEK